MNTNYDKEILEQAVNRIRSLHRSEQIKILFCHHYFADGKKTCEYCSLNLIDGLTITEGGIKLCDIIN
jgi:hypothetical protein